MGSGTTRNPPPDPTYHRAWQEWGSPLSVMPLVIVVDVVVVVVMVEDARVVGDFSFQLATTWSSRVVEFFRFHFPFCLGLVSIFTMN